MIFYVIANETKCSEAISLKKRLLHLLTSVRNDAPSVPHKTQNLIKLFHQLSRKAMRFVEHKLPVGEREQKGDKVYFIIGAKTDSFP